jgi:hypothetical protein
MALTEFAKQVYQAQGFPQQQQQGQSRDAGLMQGGLGTLTEIKLHLENPIYGDVPGVGPVTIVGNANMRGFSPVQLCIDSDHEQAWLPLERVHITDRRYEPIDMSLALAQTRGRTQYVKTT